MVSLPGFGILYSNMKQENGYKNRFQLIKLTIERFKIVIKIVYICLFKKEDQASAQ